MFFAKNYIKYIILVPIDNKNAYTVKELEIISKNIGIDYYAKKSVKEALTSSLIPSNSKVLIFGSLYLIGETLILDKN